MENGSNSIARNQRTNRARRYHYLQLNTRNANPPVILQRLLGPAAPSIHQLSSGQMISSPALRDSARVVVMDNFGIFPTVEEHIDFVDQSGYLFGSNMSATLNHIPVVLHWWREESRFIDGESMFDAVTYVCNKLIPTLMKHRNADLAERKRKTAANDPDESTRNRSKNKSDQANIEKENNAQAMTSSINPDNIASVEEEPQPTTEEGKLTFLVC